VRAAPCASHRGRTHRRSGFTNRVSVLAVLLVAGYCVLAVFGANRANADIGDLGPPPAESEIKQSLVDFYSAGQPLGSNVDVQFNGPILVAPAEHATPRLFAGVSAVATLTRAPS
jgi:hypothetical protein